MNICEWLVDLVGSGVALILIWSWSVRGVLLWVFFSSFFILSLSTPSFQERDVEQVVSEMVNAVCDSEQVFLLSTISEQLTRMTASDSRGEDYLLGDETVKVCEIQAKAQGVREI